MREILNPGLWVDPDAYWPKIAIGQTDPYCRENVVILSRGDAMVLADVISHKYRKDAWANSLRAHLDRQDQESQD
jgi:hypothetical protein